MTKSNWFRLKDYIDPVFVVYDYEPGSSPTNYSRNGDPGSPGDLEIIDIIRISTDSFTPDLTNILHPDIIKELLETISHYEGGKK